MKGKPWKTYFYIIIKETSNVFFVADNKKIDTSLSGGICSNECRRSKSL
jgi:hypothetical protein